MAENEQNKLDDQEEVKPKEDKGSTNGQTPPSQQINTDTKPKPAEEFAKNSK